MKLPRLGNALKQRIKPDDENLTERQRKVRALVFMSLRWVIMVMGGAALLYTVVSMILGSSLFIPSSAEGVLKSVKPQSSYSWNSQTVRLVKFGETEQQQDAVRGAIIDTEGNKFQASVAGVLPERSLFASDGSYTIVLEEGTTDWQLVTDICNGQEALPASSVQMPTPDDFLEANPQITTDEGTWMGERAWVIEFDPTPKIVEQMLWMPFWTAYSDENTMQWVMSEKEREKVAAGAFEVEEAALWVNRSGDRQIQQIDMKIAIEDGSRWRFLGQRVPMPDTEDVGVRNLDLGEPNCDNPNAQDQPQLGE